MPSASAAGTSPATIEDGKGGNLRSSPVIPAVNERFHDQRGANRSRPGLPSPGFTDGTRPLPRVGAPMIPGAFNGLSTRRQVTAQDGVPDPSLIVFSMGLIPGWRPLACRRTGGS